ncbi:MAG: sigma-54 dependent transcriptional regulator [Alphaproteobacteria bacterium]|nr:sigma-54 dependent transcriptional regulator [Alphaproteobacteria bacterium]
MAADILIVDDESDIREIIQGILEDEGYVTRQAANSQQVYKLLGERLPDLMILDIWLQNSDHDGLQILETVKQSHPHLPVVMISGHGTIETAVSAIKQGAYDFIEKPFKSDRLLLLMERALETANLKRENETLKRKAQGPSDLVGESTVMAGLRQTLARVAVSNSRVLITGEAGTGKDIAARTIHKLSRRANGPFVALNCAIMHPERLENELFGVEGEPDKVGVLERAHGGTLLLDEVADMPLETQGKIVRVLQEQRFQRVGGQTPVEVDVRILASSNRDLQKHMDDGHFRQDLYYRLNVVPVDMPPLRDRVQDIPDLAAYFAALYSEQAGLPACTFADNTLAILQAYKWPGNVRQLRNVIEWVMIMAGAEEPVQPHQLPPELVDNGAGLPPGETGENLMALPLRDAREMFEKEYLESQIRRFGGNISKTAQFVGMERSALHRKLKQLGISGFAKQNEEDEIETALKRA